MGRFNILRAAVVALVGFGLCACPPVTSKTPVGTTLKAALDPGLTGVWKGRIALDDVSSYFTFLPQDDGTFQVVVITPPSPKGKGGWGAFGVQTVADGPNHFMNAREVFSDGKPGAGTMADNTFPILYRLDGDGALALYMIDETAARSAIRAGNILGTIEEGQYGDITLTAAPGDLDAFMASPAGRALFIRPLVILHRVK